MSNVRLCLLSLRGIDNRPLIANRPPIGIAHDPGGLRHPDTLARAVPVNLRHEVSDTSVFLHEADELDTAGRVDVPLGRYVVDSSEQLGLTRIAIEPDKSWVGTHLPAVGGGTINTDNGVFEQGPVLC